MSNRQKWRLIQLKKGTGHAKFASFTIPRTNFASFPADFFLHTRSNFHRKSFEVVKIFYVIACQPGF